MYKETIKKLNKKIDQLIIDIYEVHTKMNEHHKDVEKIKWLIVKEYQLNKQKDAVRRSIDNLKDAMYVSILAEGSE